MNLEIINQAGMAVSVKYKDGKESIDLPIGGVGFVKYQIVTVVAPESLVYKVHEANTGEKLLMNGKTEVAVTPSETLKSPYKIIITKEGNLKQK